MDISDFRKTMSRYATGVTVVTTCTPDGKFHGITINSFTSVSLIPTLILICINKKTEAHQHLPAAGFFCVNILADWQAALSDRFAGREPNKQKPFDDVAYHIEQTGAPVFDDSLGFLDCRITQAYDGGDHTIFLAQVLALGSGNTTHDPLLYYRSDYRQIKPLD